MLRLTVARDPSKTVNAPEPFSARYSAPAEQTDIVDTEIGHVADKQTVLESGVAAVQQIQRRSRGLRAVVAEDAVAKQHGVARLAEMLDRDAAAARARVVAEDLDVLDGGVGACVDLDPAAIGVEERRLADIVRLDWRFVARPGREIVGAGDLESAKHGFSRDAVAEIDNVVDDGGEAGVKTVGDLGVGGGENDVADGFDRDAVVPLVQPDERLSLGGRPIGSGMHVDGLIDLILRRRLERVLNRVLGIDMPAA